jgi:hypothetical protein
MNQHEWLVRPSQLGQLMTKGRSKNKIFGETAMKIIQEAVLLEKYNIQPNDIYNSKLDKGVFNEKQNIALAKKVLNWQDVNPEAPQEKRVNSFFIGKPDINTRTLLADIKSSWNAQTFPWFDDPKNKIYYAQLQAYMDLTGKKQAELVYVLSNHPEHIVASEIKKLTYYFVDRPHLFIEANGIDDMWALAEEKATNIINKEAYYNHIPDNKKVRRFVIKRDDDFIKEAHERVLEARKIYDELIKII